MGAIAAELQFSSCKSLLSSSRYCSDSKKNNCQYYGAVSSSSRGGSAAFQLRSWVANYPPVSSSAGRGLPGIQRGFVGLRELRGLRGWDGGIRGGVGRLRRKGGRRTMAVQALWGRLEAPKPSFVALEQITGEDHFDQILNEAVERNQPIVVDWLAAWCRKCIYLKPKLEKLAAEYHPDIKFYYVDVNTVPQALVKRAEVTKMPTIQVWKDGQRLAEVIGGHQAWLVLEEIREMINSKK